MENRAERYCPTEKKLKKFKKFLVSSSFALLMTLHPPAAYGQEQPTDPEIVVTNPDEMESPSVEAIPTSVPAPVEYPVGSSPDEWISYFANHTGISYAYARSIAQCESRLDQRARNRSGASGFWQIMLSPGHRRFFIYHGYNPDVDWADGAANTLVAVDVAHSEGIRAWSCA